jgi:aspartate carbamoyltransferase catalytic subunit
MSEKLKEFQWNRKHLLALEDLSAEEILHIMKTTASFKEVSSRDVKKVPALRGKTVANMFFENSTRTRISFEVAAKRLSADIINFSAAGSSTSKGESLKDTVRTIEAMNVDLVVARHSASGAPKIISEAIKAGVINAGDGIHEHPTQGLLDIFTMNEKMKRIQGLKVCFIGDILHSRVARSNIWGLTKLGADVTVCGPPTLIPTEIEKLGVSVSYDLDNVLPRMDVLYILRIQLERQEGSFFPSLREYAGEFGITQDRLKRAKKDVLIMHPGPLNRGIELDNKVADGLHSAILDQVTNGVATRMAILYLISGAHSGANLAERQAKKS